MYPPGSGNIGWTLAGAIDPRSAPETDEMKREKGRRLLAALALWRLVRNRRLSTALQPSGPPIEEIAATLRQLLWDHDELLRSSERSGTAGRLRWLEKRIGDRAVQAARAIDVPHPNRPVGGYSRSQLGRLLHELTCAGLVLPRSVVLLAPDNRP